MKTKRIERKYQMEVIRDESWRYELSLSRIDIEFCARYKYQINVGKKRDKKRKAERKPSRVMIYRLVDIPMFDFDSWLRVRAGSWRAFKSRIEPGSNVNASFFSVFFLISLLVDLLPFQLNIDRKTHRNKKRAISFIYLCIFLIVDYIFYL